MYLAIETFVLLFAICVCDAGYGVSPSGPQYALSDVEAPAYVPAYARNQQFNNGYSRSGYGGTKTNYYGTKTGYTGTKTGYTGTKTGYTGTKTGYAGTKTGYGGTKTGYTESRTWNSESGAAPTYQELQHNTNQAFTGPKCEPECKNNGICIDTNTCHCPANFRGKYCEYEKKPCLTYPPLPMNSMRKCNDELCTITCAAGHKFIDGSTVANMRCLDGQWQPTRADFTSIPDCEPECDPPCLNGGVCLSVNTCQCPTEYRGPQCQYSTSVCDFRKLAFNGNYKCKGNDEEFSCRLSCPPGASPTATFAEQYTCLYSTGTFVPQPIPHCAFNEVVIVTPSNYFSGYSSSYYETYYHNGSESHSQSMGHGGSGHETIEYGKHSGGTKGTNVHIVVQDFTPKGGTCLTWAGVHYKTFDGKIYSFESPCQHILLQDAKEHEYTVVVKQGACERRDYCPLELTIYLEEKPYVLSAGEVEGSVVFRSTRRLIPIPASLPGIRVSMPGDHVVVNLDAVGVTIKWDTNNIVVVEGSVLLWNNTQGLCGRLDGNPENDFTTKEGTIAKTKSVLAASWELKKIGDLCDSSPSEPNACGAKSEEDRVKALHFCSNVFVKDKFRKCSTVMDVTQLLETCQWDYCACTSGLSPEECACNTVSVYAKECQRLGVPEMKDWRDADTCPMKCMEGKIYKSCGPDVQPSCQFPNPSPSDNATCVEGCFCPEGLLLEGGKCIPKNECPCRLRNKSFKPGSVVKKDCNTCTCQAGEWTCTAIPCGARCGAVGDPHYTTFDGFRYDFMGHCTYTLLQTDNVTVEVENVACSGSISEEMNLAPFKGEGKPSCTKAVNLKYNGVELHLKQGGFILVNGKEVATLPVHVGDVLIRAASSLFLIVQLPNGLDLWWDGNTRVFVDVPPTFHDKTKGLCGTFNLNQKDDFLTPEGDIEQSALAFANKWKTRELCQDVDTVEPEHPCKSNIENKEAAENYCKKLMTKLFEPCHWHVDVTPYYEECLYDMCACAGDASRCLCPILGDYAMACAYSGVNIQWRYNVKECELQCSGGQEYTVCADSCQRTCSDIALAARGQCRPCCVEGCACPVGQVLDGNNVCVPVGLCPCFHKGMQFDAGYKEVRAGRRERELCTCVGARWECIPATPQDIQNYPPAEDLRSNCSSANHMEFTTCEVAEPLTCKNMHLPPSTTTKECRPGCQCKKGYVLDASSNKCVLATECPCHHGGRSYPDKHEMQEECNKCKCENGNWSCTEHQCPGVCTAWGDSHVTTFDGREYEFEGVCTYLLAKGSADAHDGFEVQIQNVPCGTTGATCSKSVTLKIGHDQNEETVSLTKDAPLPDLSKLERIKLRIAGIYVFLDVPSLGMSLQWDRGMRVYVKVDPMWRNRVKGLCGNYNSDSRDDFQKPEGGIAESSALIFADSWKLKPTCPKPTEVQDHCRQRPERKDWATSSCGALKRHPFTLCHSEVPPTPFIEQCERDACACDSGDDCNCVCTALAAYAHRCADRGVVFKWRTKERCPIQCDETCATYDPCMSPCPEETCENTYYYKEILPICQRETCVEGCKPKTEDKKPCPEGEIVSNSSSTECVSRGKCKPVCMTLPDGKVILEGEVIEQDACHTCRCSKKQRVCTGQPCPTEIPTLAPIVETTPHDEPLKCVTGWTSWINRGPPETAADGHSVDNEPLPKPNELQIGQPMCVKANMTKIECRTTVNHQSPKDTRLNVECSLEKGLVCNEIGNQCPDFEIRVFCQCEEEEEEGRVPPEPPVFQCLDSNHPNYPHPTVCSKFYECTPDLLNPKKPHSVLKSCPEGLMYSKKLMVCDWPASVTADRPECKEGSTLAPTTPTRPVSQTAATLPSTITTPSLCLPGQVFKKCAFPCDSLCDHFLKTVVKKGQCKYGEKCIEGCVDKSVANVKCEFASRWRDEKTCVPLKDCTCYNEGEIVKPGGVVNEDCKKCQCLDNALHCDTSECVSVGLPPMQPPGPTHLPMIFTEPTRPTTTTTTPTTTTTTTPTTIAPLIVKTTVSPPPQCSPERYKNLLWEGEPLPSSSFTASSVENEHYQPQFAKLNGKPEDISAGSWSAGAMDTDQYIQVELPSPQPIYGVFVQGSPLFDQYVTSYEVMYGDDGHVFSYVEGPKGDRQVFRGPVDHTGVVKQMFTPPFEAKFVRIKPLTWHDAITLRFELIGCGEVTTTTSTTTPPPTTLEPLQCTEPLGLGGELPVDSIEVSSNAEGRKYFTLTEKRGWRPLYSTPGEWIMFDFTGPRNITGIMTKGGTNGWVTAYNVMYTSDLSTFHPVVDDTGAPKLFPANFDKDGLVVNEFRPPVHARYLKVLPIKWKDGIEMRVEPIGCFEPYPVTTTVKPLQCMEPLGLAADLPVDSIGVSSNNEDRKYFALNEKRGWRPQTSAPGEWIMFDFTGPRNITGIKTKGGPNGWVTEYNIMYTSDLSTFTPVTDDAGAPKVFPGNIDKENVVMNEFQSPIHARYFKVLPLKWKDNIEMRVEPIGCFEPYPAVTTPKPLECIEPLGFAADLPIESIEVSSNNQDRKYFALTEQRGWRPITSTPGEWIMFDFTGPRNITGVKTKGGPNGWVTEYNIMYTSDLSTFNPVVDDSGAPKVFTANVDKDGVVMNEFQPPIHARYFKVLPLKWKGSIEMRVEPIGCFEPYPATTPKPSESPFIPTTEACVLCPGIQSTSCDCHNSTAKYFDGDSCVSRDQCPCVEGFMTYAVGSSFRGPNCDECVCKLGGVTDCKPVKECKCALDLVPKLTSNCACLCEPCPPGTKICPTSKFCLNETSWCDGLQDCPDDEKDCATPAPTVVTTVEPTVVTTIAPTVAVTMPTTTTTVKPVECPEVKCPPGYMVRLISANRYTSISTSDLPPPRPRQSYSRYYKGGRSYAKGGFSKGGYSKGGFSKGGYGGQSPQLSQSFTLDKAALPSTKPTTTTKECQQFKCVPKLPPLRPGVTRPPQICSTPICPPGYSLRLEVVPAGVNECPQYGCVPPPERPVFCNVTGRTFNTFDGSEYKYDICYHMLARETKFGDWTIILRKKCRVDGCANELLVSQDDQLILVKPTLMIEYDNFEYTVEQTNKICFQKNSFDISKLGDGLAIKSRKYNFTVLYNTDGDVKVGISKSHHLNHVDGLCGFYDEIAANDRRLPNGNQASSVEEFGRSWAKPGLSPRACRTTVIPPEKQKRAWDLCDVITKEPLSKCAKVLNLDLWRSICLEKLCKCTELMVNGTKRTEEECRCLLVEKMIAECLAADKDLDVASWRMTLNCPADCPAPLVHYDCYAKSCEPTCSATGARQACPSQPGQCFPGCYCPEGKLRKGDACVTPHECLDCNCHGHGAPAQYTTFEGDDMPFLGNCTYLASRDRNETGQHKYEVYATNGPCEGKPSATCTKAVYVIYEKNVIHITRDPVTKKLVTSIGKTVVFKFPVKKDWVTISVVNQQDILVQLPDAYMELTVQQEKMEFGIRVPSHVYANATEGLCGVCAGYQEALVTSNGTLTGDFELYGKSWQATPTTLDTLQIPQQEQCDQPPPEPECAAPPPDQNVCYNLFDKDKFGPCHALVDPQPFLESCEADICANATDICATLEQYSSACRRQGVCLDWRSTLCPSKCEPPFVYRPCVDCERTCENHDELEKDPKKCDKKPVEGCFCPEGKVRVNNTCIEPTKCFPCDANKEHYAADEWQEDACTKCTCNKLPNENAAHVSCTKLSCPVPVCPQDEDMITTPRPGVCCPQYLCVPKPQDNPVCEEPKKMECGFGQVLKQKTTANGCKEFACECKPASECEHIPTDSEVEIMPGMQRTIDTKGCCPRAELLCRPDTCPAPDTCPPLHTLRTVNVSGLCCPEYKCELPADKCLVTLEWEAAPKGGEKARSTPQTMLKDVDSAWLDGPCRSCTCAPSPAGAAPAPRCSVAECPALRPLDQFVLELQPVPFACCPVVAQVACRVGDAFYEPGKNWTSPSNPCESYQCVEVEPGKLDKVTTLQTCPADCEPGWKYFPAEPSSNQCCGKCKPVACICTGVEHPVGETWTSPDHCTNYTCVLADGNLQVQTSNETCPEVSVALKKQFVLKEEQPAGKCCKTHEPVACRVGNEIYQEGQTWQSPDPCKNFTCSRDGTGRLAHSPQVETCSTSCKRGWAHVPPPAGVCCGHCRQDQCVVEDELKDAGTHSPQVETCSTSCKRGWAHVPPPAGVCCGHCRQDQCVVEDELKDAGTHSPQVETCSTSCKRGWAHVPPPAGVCCGHCRQDQCVVEDELKDAGTHSPQVETCSTSCKRGWAHVPPPAGVCCGHCRQDQCVVEDELKDAGTHSPQVETCSTSCKRGWAHVPPPAGVCCGHCRQDQCVVEDELKDAGTHSPQVETCSTSCKRGWAHVPPPAGVCCGHCRQDQCVVEDELKDAGTHSPQVETCSTSCKRGWAHVPPPAGVCCGHCRQDQCVVEDELKDAGTHSPQVETCSTSCKRGWAHVPPPAGVCYGHCRQDQCVVEDELKDAGTHSPQVETCSTSCKRGWAHVPPPAGVCCGHCRQDQCVVEDELKDAGTHSPQVETCSTSCKRGWAHVPPPAGVCCGHCRQDQCVVEDELKDAGTHSPQVETCSTSCKRGWAHVPPPAGVCCGHCRQDQCVVEDELKDAGTHSPQVETCSTSCKRGWAHVPPPAGVCCGHCRQDQCVVEDELKDAGTHSPQVETCSTSCKRGWAHVPPPAGVCCGHCRQDQCVVEDELKDAGTHSPQVETCSTSCKRGWAHVPPPAGVCCGHCRQRQCVVEDELKDAGSSWTSADNCTTYTCDRSGEDLLLTSSHVPCPDVTSCAVEDLVNETCCTVCKEKPAALSTCYPEAIPAADTINLIRVTLRPHGACVNSHPVADFRECRGSCNSGTVYNNQTGSHDSKCECCHATKYTKVTALLSCEDGSQQQHVVASPIECGCRSCGASLSKYPTKTGYSGVKTPQKREEYDYDIPEIYARMSPESKR